MMAIFVVHLGLGCKSLCCRREISSNPNCIASRQNAPKSDMEVYLLIIFQLTILGSFQLDVNQAPLSYAHNGNNV
jgi:hypothetical protein